MARALIQIPLALEGQWSGAAAVAVVLTSVTIFMGTIYYLLTTLFGWRRAYYIVMVSLTSFLILLSLVWLVGAPGTVPGTGPRGREPVWVPFLPTSEFAADFRSEIASFPDGWDAPGKKYFGNSDKKLTGALEAKGEIDTIKALIKPALAGYFQQRSETGASIREDDYDFRLQGTPAQEAKLTDVEKAVPIATIRFKDAGAGRLLFGVTIPGVTGKHPEVTVFAMRDKGTIFIPALYALLLSLALFSSHLWLLARDEIKQKARDAETLTTPTTVRTG